MKLIFLNTRFFVAIFLLGFSVNLLSQEKNAKIEDLIKRMTLEEKASLCSGGSMWTTKAIPRLNIPSVMMTDGPHGVRVAQDGQFGNTLPATCFPPAVTLASTWNTDLAYKVGQALGEESQTMNVQILLGPGTNIKRSPLGGRNFEYFSEDPILSGLFSTAFIKGVQEQGVGVSLKHFAVNDQEHERMTISAEVSERAFHEIYLRPFEMAVKEAHPTSLMCAYNKINGVYVANNKWLLNDILRKDWGFNGIVMTDWGAVDDRTQGIKARLHLQMPADGGLNDKKIVEAVKAGALPESELDAVVKSLLDITFKLHESKGRFTNYNKQDHHKLAKEVASEGIVLLKNENGILPLKKKDKIAVIGNFAKTPRFQGSGSSLVKPTKIDNLIDHMDAKFARGYDLLGNTTPQLIAEAKETAKNADKVIVVAGLTFLEESEGFDRNSFGIAPGHEKVLNEIIKVNSNVIVVLENGSPVAMPWINKVDAVVEAYLGGQAGGSALADVLTGKTNPSGKLAETFPEDLEDNPTHIAWAGEENKTYYNEGVYVGYRYYDQKNIKPLFPFGFGLSYTNFNFSDIQVSKPAINENESLSVSVKIKNSGKVAGKETIQLYINDPEASVGRPEKELKHFKKIFLNPGESKTVEFVLSNRDFAFYSAVYNKWITESGEYIIKVGNSSDNLPLEKKINMNVQNPPKPKYTRYTLMKEIFTHPVGKEMIENLMKSLGAGNLSKVDMSKLNEEERVDMLKSKIFMEKLMGDMPLKGFMLFSQGKMTEEDLENIIIQLNN